MNFLQLEYFCKIAELGNMTRAAEELMVSQPGLSRVLRALEDELGTSLFLRKSKLMELTNEGSILYRGAKSILQTRDQTLAQIQTGFQISGQVTIATSLYGKRLEVIQRFGQIYPKVKLRFDRPFISEEGLRSGVIYLMPLPFEQSLLDQIEAVPVMEEEFILLASENAPYSEDIPIDLADLKDETFLIEDNSAPAYHFITSLFEQAGFTPRISDSKSSNKYALVQLGVGLAFSVIQLEETRTSGTKLLHLRTPRPFRSLYLIWDKDRPITEAERCLLQYVQKAFQ